GVCRTWTHLLSCYSDSATKNKNREQTSVRYCRSQHLCLLCAGNDGVRFWIVATGTSRDVRYYRDRPGIGSAEHTVRCVLRHIAEHRKTVSHRRRDSSRRRSRRGG